MQDNYLTVQDIQKILKLGRNSTLKLVNLPDFPKVRIGKSIRVTEEDLYDYLNSYKKLSIKI